MKAVRPSSPPGRSRGGRLTRRQREILRHLRDELTYYEIADSMDLGYETVKKELQAIYRILDVHSRQEAVARACELGLYPNEETPVRDPHPAANPRLTPVLFLVPVVAIVAAFIVLMPRSHEPCAQFSDLQGLSWDEVTANWKIGPGSTITITEDAPDSYYGKVESEVLTVDTSLCPVLHIHVTHLDPAAGYTIQILDKQAPGSSAVEVLSLDLPGSQTVDLPDAMGWADRGTQVFTINLWITGEGKSFTFDHLSLDPE